MYPDFPDDALKVGQSGDEAFRNQMFCDANELYKSSIRIARPLFLEEKEKKRLAEQKRDETLQRMGFDGCPNTKEAWVEARYSDQDWGLLWPALEDCPRPWDFND